MTPPWWFFGGRTRTSSYRTTSRSGHHRDAFTAVVAVTSVAVVSVALVGCAVAKIYQERRTGSSEDDKDPSLPSSTTTTTTRPQRLNYYKQQELVRSRVGVVKTPSHPMTQLELHKQLRWHKLIPKLIMKRPMYDNFHMYDPNGTLLCTISQKKANWYVRKNLATWIDNNNDKDASSSSRDAIQLRFEPKKEKTTKQQSKSKVDLPPLSDQYNQSVKHNRCVACGSDQQYMRHYVVPSCYRVLFPHAYKTHMPHDVVLLCPSCQVPAQKANQRRQRQLERNCNSNCNSHRLDKAPINNDPHHNVVDTTNKYVVNPHLQHMQSIATALSKWKEQLPPDRVDEYQTTLCEFFHVPELNDQHLQQALNIEFRSLNPHYISGPQRVVQSVTPEGLDEFVRDWRRLFVSTMHPHYLPPGWSVDSPVRCDLP